MHYIDETEALDLYDEGLEESGIDADNLAKADGLAYRRGFADWTSAMGLEIEGVIL